MFVGRSNSVTLPLRTASVTHAERHELSIARPEYHGVVGNVARPTVGRGFAQPAILASEVGDHVEDLPSRALDVSLESDLSHPGRIPRHQEAPSSMRTVAGWLS